MPKCKICRRAGEKLFLKGEKCFTQKCAFEKKPYPPGKTFSERKHRTNTSEYGIQLREKQKIRNVYGVNEKQFSTYVKDATSRQGINSAERLYENLESRLDNVIYRLGFARSRTHSRQLVAHGHILVNGRKVTIPSYKVRKGDKFEVRKESSDNAHFSDITEKVAKHQNPSWLKLDPKKMLGEVQGTPKIDKSEMTFDFGSVIEFYSR